jgi:hypothetical protein
MPYRYKYKDKISRGRGIPRYWAGNTYVMAVLLCFYRRGGGLNHVLLSVGVGGLQALVVVLRGI